MNIETKELTRTPRLLVSRLTLRSGQSTIRHKHLRVHECYQILSGQGRIQLNDQEKVVGTGDYIHIPPYTLHKIWHDGQELLPLVVLSVKDSSADDTINEETLEAE